MSITRSPPVIPTPTAIGLAPMSEDCKPSLEELARGVDRVLLLGNGGGGDVIPALPIANHLRRLGVAEVIMGGVSCAWLGPDQDPGFDGDRATISLGAVVYDLNELTASRRLAPMLCEVSGATTLRGRKIAEAALAELFGVRAVLVGLGGGVPQAARDLGEWIEREQIGLVVSVDTGSDSFYTGTEKYPAHTPFVDFLSLGVLTALKCPIAFALIGYGCDGELLPEDIERNLAKAFQAGGYLGAHGVTQQDVVDMETANSAFVDPVSVWVPRAARGEFGWQVVPTSGPWGQPIRVSPLAAVALIFDPKVLVSHVCTAVPELAAQPSLADAERRFEEIFGMVPETQLTPVVRLRIQQAGGR